MNEWTTLQEMLFPKATELPANAMLTHRAESIENKNQIRDLGESSSRCSQAGVGRSKGKKRQVAWKPKTVDFLLKSPQPHRYPRRSRLPSGNDWCCVKTIHEVVYNNGTETLCPVSVECRCSEREPHVRHNCRKKVSNMLNMVNN